MYSTKVLVFFLICFAIDFIDAMSKSEQREVLDYHNQVRRQLAKGKLSYKGKQRLPSAGNMREMKWDDKMGGLAQKYADKCIFKHSKGKARIGGENLARTGPAANVTELAWMWINELDVNPKGDTRWISEQQPWCSFSGDVTSNGLGHFTQFVWSDMSKLGCGVAICNNGKNLVCHYATDSYRSGNVVNIPVYHPGRPCELCKGNCNDGLCTKEPDNLYSICNKGSGKPCKSILPEGNKKTGEFSVKTDGRCSAFDQIPPEAAKRYKKNEEKQRAEEIKQGKKFVLTWRQVKGWVNWWKTSG